MSGPTHTDLLRDFGRMEGRFSAMEDRLDKIDGTLERIDSRLARIEEKEVERKGAMKTVAVVAAGLGSGITIGWKLLLALLGHSFP